MDYAPLLVLGATGRIGWVLQALWPFALRRGLVPVWQSRTPQRGFLHWDILHNPCPAGAASGVVLCLAGGRVPDGQNTALALAALTAARDQGARHVFLASSAAVYTPGENLAEDSPTDPPSDYGREKRAMEQAALATGLPLTLLRIGNIAGLDALLGTPRDGPATLDPTGPRGPVRAYIGPVTLAAVLGGLAVRAMAGDPLPTVLNIATPRPVAMADLLDAAGIAWHWGPDNPRAIPAVTFDTTRLQGLIRLPPFASGAAAMVREWRGLPPGTLG